MPSNGRGTPQKINPLLLKKKKVEHSDPFQMGPNMWDAYIDKLKMMTEDIEGIKAWENDPDNPVNYGKKIARRQGRTSPEASRPRKMRNPDRPNVSK